MGSPETDGDLVVVECRPVAVLQCAALDVEAGIVVVTAAAELLGIGDGLGEGGRIPVVVGEHHVGDDIVLVAEHLLVVRSQTVVEGDVAVVVGTVIPVQLEFPSQFFGLLVALGEEILQFRHGVVVGGELGVDTDTVDAVVAEELHKVVEVDEVVFAVALCEFGEYLGVGVATVEVY